MQWARGQRSLALTGGVAESPALPAVLAPRIGGIFRGVSLLHGRVQGGRIVVQDVVDLPEGTEVRLELVEQDDDGDQLDAEDRARLEAAIRTGRQEIAEGKGIPAEQVVSELWAAHRR
jgi:hypothetical protein